MLRVTMLCMKAVFIVILAFVALLIWNKWVS